MRLSRPRVLQLDGSNSPESLFGSSFPAGTSQDLTGSSDSGLYVMGTAIRVLVNGTITHIRFYCPTVNQPDNADFAVGLWRGDPTDGISSGATLLANQAESAPTGGQAGTWVSYDLDTPAVVMANQRFYPIVRTNRYAVASQVFTADVPGTNLVGTQDTGTATQWPNGAFQDSGAAADPLTNPVKAFNSAFYGVDMTFVPA